MRAVTVIPGQPGSIALSGMPAPPGEDGPVLVETQVPLAQWAGAYTRQPGDIKTILTF